MKGLDAINDDEGPGEDPEVIEVIDGEAGPLNGNITFTEKMHSCLI